VDLPGLDEPVGLRARAVTDPDAVRAEIAAGRFLTGPLWKAWGPVLAPAGVSRATLSTILRSYGYELWLWAVGERTWGQCLEGLAGRVSRRAAGQRKPRPARAQARKKAVTPTKSTRATKRRATKPTAAHKATKTGRRRAAAPARKPAKAGQASKATKARKATTATTARKATTGTTARKTTKARKTNKAAKARRSGRPVKGARRR
jgi:hypothetical protein